MSLISSLLIAAVLLTHGRGVSAAAGSSKIVNIMVPAYFDPGANPQAWQALNSAATKLPNRVVVIANVDSGPYTSRQADYTSAITSLQRASGRVIGYVHTSYGSRSLSAVKADVDLWYSFYPSLNGIFVDEVPNTNGYQAFYQALYNYIKSKSSSSPQLVVNNPGAATLSTYLVFNGSRVADVICIFEGSGADALTFSQASWTSAYARSNFYAIAYNTPNVDVQDFDYGDVIDHDYQQNVGWVYVTDDNLPNPYDTIATYFANETYYIQQYNYLPS